MGVDARWLEKLSSYPHAVASWIGGDGYPMQTAVAFEVDAREGSVRLAPTGVPLPTDREVNVLASHIRPQPGTGYDERRYVTLGGRVEGGADGSAIFRPRRAWGWDEAEVPFFEYSERSNEQARRYLSTLSEERGRPVRPRLSRMWTVLISTRLPFLTATVVPILLGISVAARHGDFSLWLAVLTLIGGAAIHVGLNVANDVFDAVSGADDVNVNPTQYSGGSRVIQRGLVSLRSMSLVSLAAYVVGIGIGVYLAIDRASVELFVIGVVGVFLSVAYTAPPFRLVHHGLGEITTAVGFGPLMVLGAYVVQARALSFEAFYVSVPVAILIALVLYVNEIPDRRSDAAVGKRTLPARLSQDAVIGLFLTSGLAAFAAIAAGAAFGVLPVASLLALLALPIVFAVWHGLRAWYGDPYALMATMGKNVQLHLVTGLLLFAGYVIAIVIGHAGGPGVLS
jgi:1,4-dihydroxy-2-naphthoate octaprenyltransferase